MLGTAIALLRRGRNKISALRGKAARQDAPVPPPVLEFWRDHGRRWARDEADPADAARIAEIYVQSGGRGGARRVRMELQKIWRAGFTDNDAVAWDIIPSTLPDRAYSAFAEGVAETANSTRR